MTDAIDKLRKQTAIAHQGQLFNLKEIENIEYCAKTIDDVSDLDILRNVVLHAYNPKKNIAGDKYVSYAGANLFVSDLATKHKLTLPNPVS